MQTPQSRNPPECSLRRWATRAGCGCCYSPPRTRFPPRSRQRFEGSARETMSSVGRAQLRALTCAQKLKRRARAGANKNNATHVKTCRRPHAVCKRPSPGTRQRARCAAGRHEPDAVVARVRHVHVARRVHGHATGALRGEQYLAWGGRKHAFICAHTNSKGATIK